MSESSVPEESPPPPSRAFFGRDELTEKMVNLAENLIPTALIGTGGIGKTSIALTVLHRSQIRRRFGDDRWFIRCDQFPASHVHFFRRLSDVIGAGAENPEDLAPLRPFLSSGEMPIVLDNVQSILDLWRPDTQEIYTVVEELSWFSNISICITSHISTTPPDCKCLDAPMLLMATTHNTPHHINKSNDQLNLVNGILEQLYFHPLSITSPMFQELSPDTQALLGAVAFLPQGVNENNLDWLFPTISSRIFDKFCILSLTYWSNRFITMLAPLRDYLSPKDPKSSSLLCATKECYFTWVSVKIDPDGPDFKEIWWITMEDANVEHLLNVFTIIDANSDSVQEAQKATYHFSAKDQRTPG